MGIGYIRNVAMLKVQQYSRRICAFRVEEFSMPGVLQQPVAPHSYSPESGPAVQPSAGELDMAAAMRTGKQQII